MVVETKYATIDRDELKRLQADSERLDFLDTFRHRKGSGDMHFYRTCVSLYARTGIGARSDYEGHGIDSREAIDAAMLAAQGERHE